MKLIIRAFVFATALACGGRPRSRELLGRARRARRRARWSPTRAKPRGTGRAGGDRRVKASSAARGYPDKWSATENVLWKTPCPGTGNSSPIVWGDRIFLTTAYEDGRRLSVLAFRRADGARLWETFAPTGADDSAHFKNGHASATPATDGQRIYVSFGSRGLFALDINGKLLWQRDLGADRQLPRHRRARRCSTRTGSSSIRISIPGRSSPRSTRGPGSRSGGRARQASVGGARRLPSASAITTRSSSTASSACMRLRSGQRPRVVALRRHRRYEVIPTPVVGYGMVFCSSGRAGPTLAIRPGGKGDVTRTHLAWTSPRGSPFVPSPILYGEHLYMVNDMASIVTSLDAATGRVVWQGRLGVAQREGFSASPVAVDGKVFFTNDDGETFVLRAGPKFDLMHVNRIGEPTLASPALVDGRWYIRTGSRLVAIGQPG